MMICLFSPVNVTLGQALTVPSHKGNNCILCPSIWGKYGQTEINL